MEVSAEREIIKEIHSKANQARVSTIAALVKSSVTETDAVGYLIDDWIEQCGETVSALSDVKHAYRELRDVIPALPKISDKRLVQLLTMHGCAPLIRDGRYGGDGRRVRVFEMRPRKKRAA